MGSIVFLLCCIGIILYLVPVFICSKLDKVTRTLENIEQHTKDLIKELRKNNS